MKWNLPIRATKATLHARCTAGGAAQATTLGFAAFATNGSFAAPTYILIGWTYAHFVHWHAIVVFDNCRGNVPKNEFSWKMKVLKKVWQISTGIINLFLPRTVPDDLVTWMKFTFGWLRRCHTTTAFGSISFTHLNCGLWIGVVGRECWRITTAAAGCFTSGQSRIIRSFVIRLASTDERFCFDDGAGESASRWYGRTADGRTADGSFDCNNGTTDGTTDGSADGTANGISNTRGGEVAVVGRDWGNTGWHFNWTAANDSFGSRH